MPDTDLSPHPMPAPTSRRPLQIHIVPDPGVLGSAEMRTICAEGRAGSSATVIVLGEGRWTAQHANLLAEPDRLREIAAAAEGAFGNDPSDALSRLQAWHAETEEDGSDRLAAILAALDAEQAARLCAGSDREVEIIDISGYVRTYRDASTGQHGIRVKETREALSEFHLPEAAAVMLVIGTLGTGADEVPVRLPAGAADEVGALAAAAWRARQVTRWTADGALMSADPDLVPEAFLLERLNYREASELASLNAPMMSPRALSTLRDRAIPLLLRDPVDAGGPQTLITADPMPSTGYVKAVLSQRGRALIMYDGPGMVGRAGFAAKAFSALGAREISVNMISLAAGEHNMCIVVDEADREEALVALEEAFAEDRAYGAVSRISAISNCAIVSAVGDQMRERPGLAGQMFSTLGRTGVNVLAIAEGAAETNISAVVREDEVKHALRALHEAFAMNRRRAHLFVFGTGVVGRMLLEMLTRQDTVLRVRLNLGLRMVGVANTRRVLWDMDGIPFGEASARLEKEGRPSSLDAILGQLMQSRLDRLIVVDATASDSVARRYPDLLERRIAVVTPNKRANTLEMPYYDRLATAARANQIPYLYETTVGAGLPIISTLRDLVRSGDRIIRIEGVLSGTLSYVFNSLAEGDRFSEIIRRARAKGYTEPDPRDDLSGEDVARKLMILAREMGWRVERPDVSVESLVPPHLMDVSRDDFMQRIEESDAAWEARIDAARRGGGRLAYIGRIENGGLRVSVESVPDDSPFGSLRGTDNLVAYTTERYSDTPLVVRGPGAGPAVTAAGILADVVRAAELVS
jgi:bifunctional aspartokinase / homoserine dehydrogenase 1